LIIIEKNLEYGKQNCTKEILRILNDNDLFDNNISYLKSFPKDEIFYDKKFKEIPPLYQHRFKLEKDGLINYEFTLASDSNGEFLIGYNRKNRDYIWLKEYAKLLKNKEELNKLIDLGIEYFGDNRFNISFNHSSEIDYPMEKEMTRNEKLRIKEIRTKRQMYQLIDKDRTHDKFMQQYTQKGIIIVPEMLQIIREFAISTQYVY